MANNVVQKPVGIEIPITRIQTFLYDQLIPDWGRIESYGKIWKNKDVNGFLPQFITAGKDYTKDVYYSDEVAGEPKAAHFFFIVEDIHKAKDRVNYEAEVKIVFMVNLEVIYNNNNQREDSRIHKDIFELLIQKKQLNITGLETGLETVLKGFDVNKIMKSDIHPNHIFAYRGKIIYNINKC